MEFNKIQELKYIDIDFIDYEFNIEEFYIDVNDFKLEIPKPEVDKKINKETKENKNKKKDKSIRGNNLSKQSSGLSALCNKKKFINNAVSNKKVMEQIQNNKKLQQQLKNVHKGSKLPGKIENEIKKIIASNKKLEKEKDQIIVKEEMIYTGGKKEAHDDLEERLVEENETKNNQKKQKKAKKQNTPALVETKAPTVESKQMDDFISQLKSQKNNKEIQNYNKQELLSIRNYVKRFKNILTEDATKKLKVKGIDIIKLENIILEAEFLDDFINKFNEILDYCYENYSKNIEFLKLNLKEAIVLTDNLSENLITTNNLNYNLLEKMTKIFFDYNSKSESNNLQVREIDIYLLNLIYLYLKYPIFLTENNQILSNVQNLYLFINEHIESLMKKEEFRINDSKFEIIYLMKLLLNILFSSKSNLKILVLDNSSKLLIKRLENLDIFNLYLNDEAEKTNNFTNIFIDNLEELKILTKLTYIIDKHKNNIYTLNIITTKNIESKINEIQKILISENKEKYILLINRIILIFLQNYYYFQFIESKFDERSLSNLTDDIIILIKMILDERIFEDKILSEYYIINIDKFEIDDFQYSKEENTKIYIKFLLEFLKIFEKLANIVYINKNSKEKSYDLYVHFFHNIIIKILILKQNTYKEKYISTLNDSMIKQFNNFSIKKNVVDYLISFVNNNIIQTNNLNDLMKNIKILKELKKFYNSKDIKLDYINILNVLIGNNNEIVTTMNIIVFLNLVDSEEDFKTLITYLSKHDCLSKKFLYSDRKIFNFWVKNTFSYENEILTKVKRYIITNSISQINYFDYFLNVFEENIQSNNLDINVNIYKFFKSINKVLDINTNQKYYSYNTQFDQITSLMDKISKLNLDNIFLDTIQVFLLNKLSKIFSSDKDQFKNKLLEKLEKLGNSLNKTEINLKKEIENINSIESYHFDLNFNFKSQHEIFPYFLQIFHICKMIELNGSNNCFKINKKTEINENQSGESTMEKYNLDIILKYFILYILFTIKNIKSEKFLMFLSNFMIVQETMNEIFSSEVIFKSFTLNSKLLTLFVREYSHLVLDINKMQEDCPKELTKKVNLKDNYQDINRLIITENIISSITYNFSDFIINRCSNQLIKIFPEKELYRLTLIKDKRLLNLLFEKLNKEYTKTILEENKIVDIMNKIQQAEEKDEDIDLIVHTIFSKEIIQFLEFPIEIIDYLSNMHEGMKLEIKDQNQTTYLNPSIFSYFYVWKLIMSKIENGFKLFTNDKKFVKNIDDYKTILRMLVSYFERNSKIYEMFLLISMTLVHLDEIYVDEFLTGSSDILKKIDEYDESQFNNIYNENTFYFILNALYKFVKIFPSHVKFWFEKAHKKLHNTFNKIVKNIINQKMMIEIKDKLSLNKTSIIKNGIVLLDLKSQNYIDLRLNLNEEIYFEVTIEFPIIFPLKKINMKVNSNAYFDEIKMMSVKMSLNNVFNASIDNVSDNLVLWSENVKQIVLTGMDCCPICYYYIQQTDKSLPKSTCKTCKKKFHTLCMKEWFRSAEKKTCPICRSEWH